MAKQPHRDAVTGVETTGHEWDGIRELNNPLPRWWLWTFYATVLWAVGYWIVMPAWPLVSDYTRGLIGHSDRATLVERMAEARAAQGAFYDRLAAAPVAEIQADPALREFALAGGRSAFAVNCSQCHGRGAAGAKGYPNLNDDDWLWGGTLADIEQTIRFGIRSDHGETRVSEMPAFLAQGMLTRAQAGDVVEHVLALGGLEHEAAAAGRGAAVFAENCAACHGEAGTGNRELGAPNLSDAIWLFGGDRQSILETVARSRNGVMPAWQGRLDDATIKQLTIYVHALGGGQ